MNVQMDKISSCMTKFNRSPRTNPYTTITPDTPLADLESFLKNNVFALGASVFVLVLSLLNRDLLIAHPTTLFRLVTDYERKFVLGVATPQDLEVSLLLTQGTMKL